MKHFFLLLVLSILASSVQAKDSIIGDLSSKNISINTTFTGSQITIFGSIKRSDNEAIIPSDIIIEVLGPKSNLVIHKKKKVFGIWMNSNPTKITDSLSFYSLLYTKKPETILSNEEHIKTSIGKKKFFKSNKSICSF